MNQGYSVTNPKAKTIWYCHHYAGSPSIGMSYRPYYFTKAFRQQGHNAFVVSADFHHLLLNPKAQQENVRHAIIDDVPFITLKARAYQGNGLSRILNMLDYASAFKKNHQEIIALTGKPDVIIVSSAHPFHFPILKKIADKYQSKLIFEVRDLWPLSLQILLKKSAFHPLILYLSYLERKAYKQSDNVVSVLQNASSYMQSKGLKQEKFHYIPNGVCLEEQSQQAKLPDTHSEKLNSLNPGLFKLGYAGALGEPNAMTYAIDAMHLLQQKNIPVHLIIIGDGQQKAHLQQQAQQLKLTNVTFLPRISKKAIPTFLKEMDALYLGWQPSDIYQYGVSPNKLFDYMASGKPIIESGGDMNGIVKQAKCGLQCEAGKVEEIAELIHKLMQLSVNERAQLGDNGYNAMKSFNYMTLAKSYSQVFETLS